MIFNSPILENLIIYLMGLFPQVRRLFDSCEAHACSFFNTYSRFADVPCFQNFSVLQTSSAQGLHQLQLLCIENTIWPINHILIYVFLILGAVLRRHFGWVYTLAPPACQIPIGDDFILSCLSESSWDKLSCPANFTKTSFPFYCSVAVCD